MKFITNLNFSGITGNWFTFPQLDGGKNPQKLVAEEENA